MRILAVSVLLLLIGVSFSVNVNSCINITSSNTYTLNASISGAPNDATDVFGYPAIACIKIYSPNTILDCNGFTITGPNNGSTSAGVLINLSASNVTVKNCPGISLYTYGVLGEGNNLLIKNNTFFNNTNYGADFFLGNNSVMDNNTAYQNAFGYFIDESESNNITNNIAYNNFQRGFETYLLSGNLFQNNVANNNSRGFNIRSTSSSSFLNNNMSNNNVSGMYLEFSSSNTITGNIEQGSPYGFNLNTSGDNFNTLTNNSANNNTFGGFHLVSDFNTFVGNNATSSSFGYYGFQIDSGTGNSFVFNRATNDGSGFRIFSGSGNVFTNNNASNNNFDGFEVDADSNSYTANLANGNSEGFFVNPGSSNNFTLNTADGNSADGFYLLSTANNMLDSNAADGNSNSGIKLNNSNNTILNNNLVSQNGNGTELVGSLNNVLSNNVISNNTLYGLHGYSGSTGNTLTANNASGNSFGIEFDTGSGQNNLVNNSAFNDIFSISFYSGSGGNTLTGNTVHNDIYGFNVENSPNNTLTGNTAYLGSNAGYLIYSSDNNILSGNTAYNDSIGIDLRISNNNQINSGHFFNNNPDFKINASGIVVNLTSDIFDNPLGNFTNYTNFSLNDSLSGSEAYSLNWSAEPAALPAGTSSVAGKHLNITKLSGSPSIDALSFSWLPADVALVQESTLKLWKYNGTWIAINSTPDVTNHRLNNYSLSSFSVLSVLSGPPPSSSGGGTSGGGNPSLTIQVDSVACSNNTITVIGSGVPVPGAIVYVDGSSAGTTDQNGQISFQGCGKTVQLTASAGGYNDGQKSVTLIDCNLCPKCTTNNDCPTDQMCGNGQCVPVVCNTCGQTAQNHTCAGDVWQCGAPNCAACPQGQSCGVDHTCKPLNATGCTSDTQCKDNQVCLTQAGAPGSAGSPGACKDLCPDGSASCQCSAAINHKLVPYNYQCGSEPGCPQCPLPSLCSDHVCVQSSISCPSAGVVGEQKTCSAMTGNQSCVNCDVQITSPDGTKTNGKTDGSGNFNLQLNLEGTYGVSLLKNGSALSQVQVKALPKSAPAEQPKPTSQGTDLFSYLWLVILLLLIIGGILYWNSRKK